METQKEAPLFKCNFTSNIPELLYKFNCSLAFSANRPGKLMLINPELKPDGSYGLRQLPRTYKKMLGFGIKGDRMAISTEKSVVVLTNSKEMASTYPPKPNVYDAMYIPIAQYFTGSVNMHDVHWGNHNDIWAVSTAFSCIVKINHNYHFTPVWKPPFITKITSDDRCHLNCMAMQDGKPKYISALGKTDEGRLWKNNLHEGGIIMEVPSGEIICDDLAMPHSVRIYDGKLYALLSASGDFVQIDPHTGKYDIITNLDGMFARGMAKIGDYVFIGTSKIREGNIGFNEKSKPGIQVVHLPSGKRLGGIFYETTVEEIYDLHVLPNMKRPNILGLESEWTDNALVGSHATYWRQKLEDEGLGAE